MPWFLSLSLPETCRGGAWEAHQSLLAPLPVHTICLPRQGCTMTIFQTRAGLGPGDLRVRGDGDSDLGRVTEPATSGATAARFSACSNPSSPPPPPGGQALHHPELIRRPEAEAHLCAQRRVLVPPRAGARTPAHPTSGTALTSSLAAWWPSQGAAQAKRLCPATARDPGQGGQAAPTPATHPAS